MTSTESAYAQEDKNRIIFQENIKSVPPVTKMAETTITPPSMYHIEESPTKKNTTQNIRYGIAAIVTDVGLEQKKLCNNQ